MKTNKFKKICAAGLAALAATSFAACGSGTNSGNGGNGGSTKSTELVVWFGADTYDQKVYEELVSSYNNGQGKTDGVTLKVQYKGTNYSSSISSNLNKSKSAIDVVMVADKYFKPLAKGNNGRSLLADISSYVNDKSTYTKDENGNYYLDLSDFSDNNVYRYRYDYANKTAGGGSDSPLYGLPNGSNPTVIAYNKSMFSNANINIISVAEEDLAAYNAKNGTAYKAHGYAEYTEEYASANGMSSLKASTTLEGETVVKVFNDKIPLNWSELVNLARYFSKATNSSSPSLYGFATEWWFSYGWSVGGNCIQWDEASNGYKFTLGNDDKNYLVTKNVTIDGQSYSAGEVLDWNDMQYVKNNSAAVANYLSDGTLTAIASQYEAFTEFTALTLNTSVEVVNGKYAYAVAPDSAKMGDRTNYFASGSAAMMVTTTDELPRLNASLKQNDGSSKYEWGIAPCWQYREYGDDGVDVEETMSGTAGELKKIGKQYDGAAYTGEPRTVNGVKVYGEQAALSENTCYAVAANCTDEERAAAWKFIQYACGTAGQKIMAKSGKFVPNQMSYARGEYLTLGELLVDMSVAVEAATYSTLLDKAYVEDSAWADDWATPLNELVRAGYMSLDVYFNGGSYSDKDGKTQNFNSVIPAANEKLSGYKVRLLNK